MKVQWSPSNTSSLNVTFIKVLGNMLFVIDLLNSNEYISMDLPAKLTYIMQGRS